MDTAVIEMAAHKYVSETIPATCSAPGGTKYTCSVCGKTYTETATVGWSDWSETKPAGVEDSLIESKTQCRFSKYETKTSYNTSESGWTRKSSDWEKANSGSVTYVKSWPGGFHTGNALYGTYNKTPVSASETATAKTVVNSEAVSGYIYWHWCRGSYTAGPINRRVSDVCEGEFQTFHAFFSTSNASSTDKEGANGGNCKYYPNGGCCADTYWYFQIPVYTQSYTNYKKLFTYERWTDWSDWGDKEISASDTRKVETRTVYRYYTAAKEHTWDAGTVTAAATCTADGAKTYTCSVCQTTKTEPIAKLGHDYRQTVVAATCTAKGYTLNKCSRCGDEYRDAETAMLPHKYVDGVCTACGDKVTMFTLGAVTAKAGDTVTVPVEIKNNTGFAGFTLKITADANLTLTGIAKGELMEKANSGLFVDNVKGGVINWTSDRNITGDGVLLKLTFTVADNAPDGKYEISVALKDDEASNCVDENGRALRAAFEAGSVLVSAAPHMHDYAVTVTAPTCTEKGYTTHTCSCGDSYVDTYVDALGHAWDNGKVTKEPTETETGVKTFTCTRCGETRTETIPATGVMDVTKMFTDVSHSWADDGIQYCVTHQLMSGIGNNLFGPKLTTTRAQIVQILYNLEGEPKVSGTTPFTDLTNDWYKDAVLWAYQTGVVAGTSGTTFAPDQPVTREQIAVILMEYMTRVLKLERTWTPADLSTFPDAGSVSDWAKDAMADAVGLGLISGASNGGQTLLEPQGSATREQVATILMEFCKNVKK
ncbi:MAG: S-layer homology domain-containing protein [Oscillospiraceae bacterium]